MEKEKKSVKLEGEELTDMIKACCEGSTCRTGRGKRRPCC